MKKIKYGMLSFMFLGALPVFAADSTPECIASKLTLNVRLSYNVTDAFGGDAGPEQLEMLMSLFEKRGLIENSVTGSRTVTVGETINIDLGPMFEARIMDDAGDVNIPVPAGGTEVRIPEVNTDLTLYIDLLPGAEGWAFRFAVTDVAVSKTDVWHDVPVALVGWRPDYERGDSSSVVMGVTPGGDVTEYATSFREMLLEYCMSAGLVELFTCEVLNLSVYNSSPTSEGVVRGVFLGADSVVPDDLMRVSVNSPGFPGLQDGPVPIITRGDIFEPIGLGEYRFVLGAPNEFMKFHKLYAANCADNTVKSCDSDNSGKAICSLSVEYDGTVVYTNACCLGYTLKTK